MSPRQRYKAYTFSSSMSIFGDWVNDIPSLHDKFRNAKPYEHVTIPNFLNDEVAREIVATFPDPKMSSQPWKHYDNPIEQKYTLNEFQNLPMIKYVFDTLQSPYTVDLISRVTGISQLESDPYFHGAGIHAYPNRGKLDMHLDYSIHPITQKERRVNLIIYMNPDWKSEYGGFLELWDEELQNRTEIVAPSWNTAVLFRTNNISYHGLPKPITCPENEYRKSLAIYYVSPPTDTAKPRYKAEFYPLPTQPVTPSLRKLYEIRKHRLITSDDLADWPTWRQDGGIYW